MKTDARDKIKKQIAEGNMSHIYLLWGEEDYLKEEYANRIQAAVYKGDFPEFNLLVYSENITPGELRSVFETYPMMSDTKFILIKDSGIFAASGKEERNSEEWKSLFSDIPDYVYAVFLEKNADKRTALYKAVNKNHTAAQFEHLGTGELAEWTVRKMTRNKRSIKKEDALYIVLLCSNDLMMINSECDKLISYTSETVTRSDIDRLVSKSADIRVFDITDAIIEGDTAKALAVLDDLSVQNTPVFQILYLLSGCFDKMLQCRLMLEESFSLKEISAKLDLHEYIVKKYISGAKKFSIDFLENMLMRTAEIDFNIKLGQTGDRFALEEYVIAGLRNFRPLRTNERKDP